MRGDSLQLSKEIIRQKNKLEPYNNDAVRNILHETKAVFDNVFLWNETIDMDGDLYRNNNQARLVALKYLIEHNKRILMAYHCARLDCISAVASNLDCLPIKFADMMTKSEVEFYDRFKENLQEYNCKFGGIIQLIQKPNPPRDLYIQVRVDKDCGVIQTEWGQLNLSSNSFHYLRRSDVQKLIDQGLITHIP